MIIGGVIGVQRALKVEMTEMPELVAILHSFVGLAAVLVGFNSYGLTHETDPVLMNIHNVEVFLGIFIGAVTFTGSIVAFGKLSGKINSKALMLPHRHKLNLAALVVSALLMIAFLNNPDSIFPSVTHDSDCTCIRLAPSGIYWWCGYAGCGFNA